jgi:hypothetical protein
VGKPPADIMDLYFYWLYDQVLKIYDPASPLSYTKVCAILHKVKFDDSTPNDDNRARDGMELRDEFISSLKEIEVEDYTQLQSLGGCSMMEMLIALTRRADYIVEYGQRQWFKIFLENLDLWKFPDSDWTPRSGMKVTAIVNKLNHRQYTRSGRGGIFPLRKPKRDQRGTEIWYQMSAYMTENELY